MVADMAGGLGGASTTMGNPKRGRQGYGSRRDAMPRATSFAADRVLWNLDSRMACVLRVWGFGRLARVGRLVAELTERQRLLGRGSVIVGRRIRVDKRAGRSDV
jgi:hypothetical protein